MLRLGEIRKAKGSNKNTKRLGRGPGSGQGKTAGKGHKGQQARAGGRVRLGFEGGQMPLYRRVPKKGFTNVFRQEFAIINLDKISQLSLKEISLETLKKQLFIELIRGAGGGRCWKFYQITIWIYGVGEASSLFCHIYCCIAYFNSLVHT